MKMKHGWIIQDKDSKKFAAVYIMRDGGIWNDWSHLRGALVYATRKKARDNRLNISDEIVRKVELYKNGKAKKIIPGR